MNCKIYLSGHLKEFSGGLTEFSVDGENETVGEVLDSLWRQHLKLRDRILNERGEIRPHVNIFCNGDDIRRITGLETRITDGAELHIFNAVSGG